MSRLASKLTLVIAAVSLTTLSATAADACGHGGGGRGGFGVSFGGGGFNVQVGSRPGGYGGGYGGGYHQPVYTQPRVIHQPQVYQQPAYQEPSYQQPMQQQPAYQQPMGQNQAPMVASQQPNQSAQPGAPQQFAGQQGGGVSGSAEQSALEALAALGGAESAPAVPQFGPAGGDAGFAGMWVATLPGENRVELQLNADGTFRWTANSRGKVSSFEGSFTVAEGRLVLVRSDDQQQLAGSWSIEGNGAARFRLNGAQDAGLLFARG